MGTKSVKRVWQCGLILLSLCIMAVVSLVTLTYSSNVLVEQADKALHQWQIGDKEGAKNETKNLHSLWEEKYKLLAMLVEQQKLADIHSAISRVMPYIEYDNDEAAAELEQIVFQLELLRKNEMPTLYNIF